MADYIQKLARDERETAVTYNEADGFWEIYTAVQKHIRKFDKLGYECTRVEHYEDGEIMAKFYKVPQHAISFRSPEKKQYTDEQRKEMGQRLRESLHSNGRKTS